MTAGTRRYGGPARRACGHPLGDTRWCPTCAYEESRHPAEVLHDLTDRKEAVRPFRLFERHRYFGTIIVCRSRRGEVFEIRLGPNSVVQQLGAAVELYRINVWGQP